MNNYIYQKTILQMNLLPFQDSGVGIMLESAAYSSPISVIHYEFYDSVESVKDRLILDKEQIQCISSVSVSIPGKVAPGMTQKPQLWEYADGVDTLEFLLNL